jgi:hypothetical protein
VSTVGRIDAGAVVRLARTDLPRPLDVLIHLGDERAYARYAAPPRALLAKAR